MRKFTVAFRPAVIFLTLLSLTSCTNNEADHALAQKNFSHLMGQPVQTALNLFGPEDTITHKGTNTIYRWKAVKDSNMAQSDPNYSDDPTFQQCIIGVLAKDDGIIAKGRMEGNSKSCRHFDSAINDYFPYYPNGKLINRSYLRRAEDNNMN